MSRAINVSAAEAEVLSRCKKHGATVSAIETLASGGSRVVLTSADAAETMRRVFRRELLTGAVERVPLRIRAR